MNTAITEMQSQAFKFDQLAPSTQAAMRLAPQEAARMQAPEVYPEHLFLAVLAQDDDGVAKALSSLGLDLRAIRGGVTEIFGAPAHVGSGESDLPLSQEALACIAWAFTFATQMLSSLLFPKHLLLGVLRHPRIQPLLVLLLPPPDGLPASMLEAEGPAYTSYIDQLIHSRVREQSTVIFPKNAPKRVLKSFERPGITFSDIRGLDAAKHELREMVAFLRKPRMFLPLRRTFVYGVLLVGHPCTDRTLLVRATAGEAVVPLIFLSLSTLVDMLVDLDTGLLSLEELDLAEDEYNLFKNSEPSQRGRNMLRHIFDQARRASPCVLFLDHLDAIARLATKQERAQWLKQILVEMDELDYYPPMGVIATARQTDVLDQSLLQSGRFERQIVISSGFMTEPAMQTKLCLSCRYEGLSSWKYCVYCGALLAQVCPRCGTLSLQIEGARYCFECGNPFSSNI